MIYASAKTFFSVLRKNEWYAVTLTILLLVFLFSCSQNKEQAQNDNSTREPALDKSKEVPSGELRTLPGFNAELLYEVPRKSQGTWVSLAIDEQGSMVASDEYHQGMYRIDVQTNDDGKPKVQVTKMVLPATGAQGLTWFKKNLYANVYGSGLFRMSASQKDGILDEMKFLGGPQVSSDHGNHALVPIPDGSGLYVVNGNHTPLPEKYTSRVLNWREDILLTRQWDARGHARGILAPGGYIARIDGDARNWDILSVGYRNQYDVAIHPNGELFTFDSDMEWDIGMPWYRPTRILHVVSGSDYGWRSGSGKWKDFYEDSHPPVLDVGPASPTGVLFGTGARFPEKYQKALFALDWTYGTIYAFHLKPKGASYTATAEEFLSGHPLAVADAVIGKDGAMYFITGGWSNDTKLYRVTYTGEASTDPVQYREDTEGLASRKIRHRLEAFHGRRDAGAVAAAWPYLADEDQFIRSAARVAIEFQPISGWIARAKAETRPQAVITSTVALARAGDSTYLNDALTLLEKLDFVTLDNLKKLGYLRALSLSFMRLGKPDQAAGQKIADRLMKFLPDKDERVNVELVRSLIYLKEARVISIALDLIRSSKTPPAPDWGTVIKRNNSYGGTIQRMLDDPPPVNKLEYLFMLRDLGEGWTIDQRKNYFSMINEAAGAMGGESYWGFLERMRNEALLGVPDEHRVALGELISKPIAKAPPFEIKPVKGPGKNWTVDNALQAVNKPSGAKSFEQGRNAFFATGCASCHRFDGMGGNIGPDLGAVGNRFSVQKILEDIIHPSETISDLYGSSRVTLNSGRSLEGLVVKDEAFIRVYSREPNRAPDIVSSSEVASIEPVPVSQMPPGLINSLNADELSSLIAYLRSGGDPKHEAFR
ncbi:c-type cytochrome [Agriterribacter sp.]|uniref:c-type cytochrome n=1 Tax=Agriterribacter sp. TaxID=2821509 RepID=UPI002C6AD555|nr:c-type cytochrome [Agriterribacter sp.]HRO44761.1 c-type cytochrome [Agriterribacter sp.]HRQ16434.1 c-type cytochrome [Agriterribacter sp.]